MRDFIGIPYRDGGRDYTGADCWGLVWLYYRDELGVDLPPLAGAYQNDDRKRISQLTDETMPLVGARKVDVPIDGDIVLMRMRGMPTHVGVYVSPGMVLHTHRRTDSVIQRIDSLSLRSRIEGYYRVDR